MLILLNFKIKSLLKVIRGQKIRKVKIGQIQKGQKMSDFNQMVFTETTRQQECYTKLRVHLNFNLHAPDRFTPSRARCAENCGSALTR